MCVCCGYDFAECMISWALQHAHGLRVVLHVPFHGKPQAAEQKTPTFCTYSADKGAAEALAAMTFSGAHFSWEVKSELKTQYRSCSITGHDPAGISTWARCPQPEKIFHQAPSTLELRTESGVPVCVSVCQARVSARRKTDASQGTLLPKAVAPCGSL